MDICPAALMATLQSDIRRCFGDSESDYLDSEVSFTHLAEPKLVAAHALLKSILKKYSDGGDIPGADAVANDRAEELFLAWNSRCEKWLPPVCENDVEREAVGEFREAFLHCFEAPDGQLINFSELAPMHFRPGPGASVGCKVNDLYSKLYAGPMSTTREDLYWHYYSSQMGFALENEAEEIRSRCFATTIVGCSKLGFAPKNRDISRTTCTEPSLNMIYQLATGRVLEGVLLERFNIDLSIQPTLNQEMSRIGSISGRYGTADLSSASDATALPFWNWLMAYPEIQYWFNWIRSESTTTRSGVVKLHMLSSMGNGFTFPLMTLLFCCVVKSVYKVLGIRLCYNRTVTDHSFIAGHPLHEQTIPGNFGVFGDDIVVVKQAFPLVCRLLNLLGYEVNSSKSFNAGPFRESCGTDWFLGQNVRGVYCKSLSRPQNRYVLINRLNAWSAEWDIPLPDTVGYLLKSVWFIPVPPWEAADAGVIVPLGLFTVKALNPYGGFVYSAMRAAPNQWEPASGLTPEHIDVRVTPWRQVFDYSGREFENIPGVILGYVRGTIVGGRISCRSNDVRYKKSRFFAPGWAYTGESSCGFSMTGWARFERVLANVNLSR